MSAADFGLTLGMSAECLLGSPRMRDLRLRDPAASAFHALDEDSELEGERLGAE